MSTIVTKGDRNVYFSIASNNYINNTYFIIIAKVSKSVANIMLTLVHLINCAIEIQDSK